MNFSNRMIAWIALVIALMTGCGELLKLNLPTLSWPFEISREMPLLRWTVEAPNTHGVFLYDGGILWFGWLCVLILCLLSSYLFSLPKIKKASPLTQRRWNRFTSLKRGYYSLLIIIFLGGLCCLDQLFVGKQALVVHSGGEWYFPALVQKEYPGKTFGLTGDEAESETNYRLLKALFQKKKGTDFVLMPPIPYSPTGDSLQPSLEKLTLNQGLLCKDGKPYSGLASRFYDTDIQNQHLRFRFRQGVQDGPSTGWLPNRNEVYAAQWKKGQPQTETWNLESTEDIGTPQHTSKTELNFPIKKGPLTKKTALTQADKTAFFNQSPEDYYIIHYHPAPMMQGGHLLGTTPQGADIVAYLFGGLQVNFKAALFFLPCVYLIGITIGMLMGYYGGWFDLIVQRLIEIFSQIPFLLVIIILSSMIPLAWRGLPLILGLLILFSWMGMTYQLRSSTMKEKSRDYVAAARVMGASTPRILFVHILPNLISLLVTLVPFSVSALILSLASLDYLGFGLPDKYASWGRLLNDGLTNLSSPWVVSTAFVALVGTLLLVTFIGEAVREAYDPKKFTYYR